MCDCLRSWRLLLRQQLFRQQEPSQQKCSPREKHLQVHHKLGHRSLVLSRFEILRLRSRWHHLVEFRQMFRLPRQMWLCKFLLANLRANIHLLPHRCKCKPSRRQSRFQQGLCLGFQVRFRQRQQTSSRQVCSPLSLEPAVCKPSQSCGWFHRFLALRKFRRLQRLSRCILWHWLWLKVQQSQAPFEQFDFEELCQSLLEQRPKQSSFPKHSRQEQKLQCQILVDNTSWLELCIQRRQLWQMSRLPKVLWLKVRIDFLQSRDLQPCCRRHWCWFRLFRRQVQTLPNQLSCQHSHKSCRWWSRQWQHFRFGQTKF